MIRGKPIVLLACAALLLSDCGASFDGKSADEWIEILETPGPESTERLRDLVAGGEESLPVVEEILAEGSPVARTALLFGLLSSPLPPDELLALFRPSLDVELDWERVAALLALRRFSPPVEAMPLLREKLADESDLVRQQAVEGLMELGEAARPALPDLIARTEDESEPVRAYAIRAIAEVAPDAPETADALVAAIRREYGVEGAFTDLALRSSVDRERPLSFVPEFLPGAMCIRPLGDPHWYAMVSVLEVGEPMLPRLRELAEDENPAVAVFALVALARQGREEAIAGLRRFADSDDPYVRYNASMAIARAEEDDAARFATALFTYLTTEDDRLRSFARIEMRENAVACDPEVRSRILDRLESSPGSPDGVLLGLIVTSLTERGAAALLEYVLPRLDDRSPEVRLSAVRMIGRIGPRASGASLALSLRREAEEDPAVRAAMDDAIERLASRE